MNRPVFGRPSFNSRVLVASCVVLAAVTSLPPGGHCSDDSLRSALEAISGKIGETPSRVVYLGQGNTCIYIHFFYCNSVGQSGGVFRGEGRMGGNRPEAPDF